MDPRQRVVTPFGDPVGLPQNHSQCKLETSLRPSASAAISPQPRDSVLQGDHVDIRNVGIELEFREAFGTRDTVEV